MSWIADVFGRDRALIGMLHVGPLPGAPGWSGDLGAIIDRAIEEAAQYQEAGFDGLLLENMHDRPFLPGHLVGPETVAAMAVLGLEIRKAARLPLGIQVLAAANHQALAVALACQADFVRVEGFVFAHVADEGILGAQAGELLRYRDQLRANQIKIIADIKKKHSSHSITADVSLVETAKAAEFFLADGVIVTGSSTAMPASPGEVQEVARAVHVPTWVGSGLTPDNLHAYESASGLIVGSWVKRGGVWDMPLDTDRLTQMVDAFEHSYPRKSAEG